MGLRAFRVWNVVCRVVGLGIEVIAWESRIWSSDLGPGLRVQSLVGYRVQGVRSTRSARERIFFGLLGRRWVGLTCRLDLA